MTYLSFIKTNFEGDHRRELLYSYYKKRIMDIVISLSAVVILFPIFLITALLVKITSKGPVFYIHKRVGWDQQQFDFIKFRSMYIDADARKLELAKLNQHGESGITFKIKNDPRITPIGRFIRRYSIDELPQLWSVLIGDMSLVGPRPPLPSEVENYKSHEKMRLMAMPGITGIWQVSGRSDIGFHDQYNMDLMYMSHYSIRLDITILVKTISAVLKGRGAY